MKGFKTDGEEKFQERFNRYYGHCWHGAHIGGNLEVRKSGIASATEDTGLGLFARVHFHGKGEAVIFFEKDTHYTCEQELKMNVTNL